MLKRKRELYIPCRGAAFLLGFECFPGVRIWIMGVLISGGKQYLTLIKSPKYSPCFPLYIQLQPKVKSKVSQAILRKNEGLYKAKKSVKRWDLFHVLVLLVEGLYKAINYKPDPSPGGCPSHYLPRKPLFPHNSKLPDNSNLQAKLFDCILIE